MTPRRATRGCFRGKALSLPTFFTHGAGLTSKFHESGIIEDNIRPNKSRCPMDKPNFLPLIESLHHYSRVAFAMTLMVSVLGIQAQGKVVNHTEEYGIKAAWLTNFLKYVDWPPEKQPRIFIIGILGENPFELKWPDKIGRIPLRVIHVDDFASDPRLEDCHLVFVSASEKENLAAIMQALRRLEVMTVSELDGFLEGGGMINFLPTKNRVRFELDQTKARNKGFRLRSPLLQKATRVIR